MVYPLQTKPNQTKPNQTKPNQTKPNNEVLLSFNTTKTPFLASNTGKGVFFCFGMRYLSPAGWGAGHMR